MNLSERIKRFFFGKRCTSCGARNPIQFKGNLYCILCEKEQLDKAIFDKL